VTDPDKPEALEVAREFAKLGFDLIATEGTKQYLSTNGVKCEKILKINEGRPNIADAIKKLGKKVTIQGNLDPCALFLPKEKLEERVKDILWKGEIAKSHIFNLGHGVLPQTPVENVIALVEAVHTYGKRS
jgi:uroporphyrinogen-III decarboxylase